MKMSEPMWLDGDPVALGMDDCDECGHDHDIDAECVEDDDPDRMWDEMHED
jgi:hypothetical protein